MSFDRVDPSVEGQFNLLNDVLARSFILASVVEVASETMGLGDIYEEVHGQLMELRDDIGLLQGVRLIFNGEGFAPYCDKNGSYATAFCRVDSAKGVLTDAFLLDPVDISFLQLGDPEEELEEDGLDHESSVRLVDPQANNSDEDMLRRPDSRPRLYLEFQTGENTTFDQYVGGISVRASNVRTYNVMDPLRTTVELVEEAADALHKLTPPHELASKIEGFSYQYLRFTKTKPFRQMSARRQKDFIEAQLLSVNEQLQLERYGAFLMPKKAYFILEGNVDNPGRKIVKANTAADGSPFELRLNLLRVDTLDLFQLCRGEKITPGSSMIESKAGLYLVGAINQGFLDCDGGKSQIVWIPISSQDFEGYYYFNQD